MRLANVGGRVTVVVGDGYVDVERASSGRFSRDPQAVFGDWPGFRLWADSVVEGSAVQETSLGVLAADLDAPVPAPRQVFAIALNYADHVREAAYSVPESPGVFTKFPSCLAGPNAAVVLPTGTVDWEAELVVVIGERCEKVSEAAAWSRVAGLMVGQDLSERRLQMAGPAPQFSLGKSFPGFGPTGPVLVTPDEFDHPNDLEIGCRLEAGEILQKSRTSNLIFSVPELIARLSAVCPLLPGDLIFTGTPAGVGGTRVPPKFLTAGDVLVSWVEGIGTLRNPMVAVDNPFSRAGVQG
jgi:2-keto-4-pentenoate hydratase/2-oxohepta-3-ene-1,7-dioic acid hydratase in catechol pathway